DQFIVVDGKHSRRPETSGAAYWSRSKENWTQLLFKRKEGRRSARALKLGMDLVWQGNRIAARIGCVTSAVAGAAQNGTITPRASHKGGRIAILHKSSAQFRLGLSRMVKFDLTISLGGGSSARSFATDLF